MLQVLWKMTDTFIEPRNTAIPSGKLCKLMPACSKKNQDIKNETKIIWNSAQRANISCKLGDFCVLFQPILQIQHQLII